MAIQYAIQPLQSKTSEITKYCFDWCKEQSFIHQQNLGIQELSFIVIALILIVVHNVIHSYWDSFRNQGFDEEFLEMIFDATSFGVFVMLIMFLIYMSWFR